MSEQQLNDFIERYVAMWHEPDATRREALVRSLWAEDAGNYTRRMVARGIDEIIGRVTRAHEEWVASKGFVFRRWGSVDAHNGVVKFFWEMVPRAGGAVESRGLDIFILRDDGRIGSLYQFGEPLPPPAA